MSDPFDLMGLPASFDLDAGLLAQRHRELSRALHPDRYVGRGASERRQALGKAIEVNEAYRILKDPVRRAELLLRRLGVEVGEQAERQVDPDFLMQIMELRESLSELRQARDAAGVERLCERVNARESAARQRLEAGFREALGAGALAMDTVDAEVSNELAQGLLPIVAELRYYARFFAEAHAILDELV